MALSFADPIVTNRIQFVASAASDSAPKGQPDVSPGQSAAAKPRSVALGCGAGKTPSPERAARPVVPLVPPFQGFLRGVAWFPDIELPLRGGWSPQGNYCFLLPPVKLAVLVQHELSSAIEVGTGPAQ
jgi:hypothetical protein